MNSAQQQPLNPVQRPELDTSEVKVSRFLSSLEPYIFNNLQMITACAEKHKVRCVKVTKEIEDKEGALVTVGTVASEMAIVRFRMPDDIEEGMYLLSKTAPITKLPPRSYWDGYYNIDSVKPNFQELGTLNPVMMDKRTCGSFATFCQAVRTDNGHILMSKDGVCMYQNRDRVFNFPFGIKDAAVIHPEPLILVFKHAQLYDAVFITRGDSSDKNMPLVIGFNWQNCMMVSTQSAHAYCKATLDSYQ